MEKQRKWHFEGTNVETNEKMRENEQRLTLLHQWRRRFSISTQTYFGFSNDNIADPPKSCPPKHITSPNRTKGIGDGIWNGIKERKIKRGAAWFPFARISCLKVFPPFPLAFPFHYLNRWYAVSLAIFNVSA